VSARERFEAASATRALGGKPARIVRNGWFWAAAVGAVATALVQIAVGPNGWLALADFAVLLALCALLVPWMRRLIARSNEAYGAFLEGDLDAAEQGYAGVLQRPCTEMIGSYALTSLGSIALYRGEHADARALLAAAWEIESRRWGARTLATNLAPAVCAAWGFALAIEGHFDEAERVLARAQTTKTVPVVVATLLRTRAFVALRRGRAAEAVEMIEGEQALLRNTLSADDTALVQAIRSCALARAGEGYRGSARVGGNVSVDAEARAYVLRALPDAAAVLVEE
jgi:hypothetical protein